MESVKRYHVDSALSGFLVLALLLHYAHIFPGGGDIFLIVAAAMAGTMPVLWNAVLAVRQREWASMDMLASIALIFSLLDLQWASAAFIALMLASARILGAVTEERTERGIKGLLKLRPETAKVERGGKVQIVPLGEVVVGDIVIVDLGEYVPIDGSVISGTASINESSLTGESLPVEKGVGSKVFSSTLVASGSIRIKTEKVGKDTTLEKIIALVESARAEKPQMQTLGEKFGKIYLISVFIVSGILLFITHNVSFVLSVVLVVCADDVAIAIPLAYLGAIGVAARYGVIVKGGAHLEALGSASSIVFDKTGTLTKGNLAVSHVTVAEGHKEKDVVAAAMFAACRSKHPVSRAIVAYGNGQGCEEESGEPIEEIGGKGIVTTMHGEIVHLGRISFLQEQGVHISPALETEANAVFDSGQSVTFVAKGKETIGFLAVADELRHNAKQVMEELKELGIRRTVMLTGDNERVAAAVAKKIGIDDFHAGLLPDGKVAVVNEMSRKETVVMVGDGVNDAAALSAANVGIAMGAMGVDAAIESAEIVLMHDDLSRIPDVILLARSTRRIAIEDFWIWGITNIFGLALVFAGFIGPTGAAAYNFISDFFPILNSARVRMNLRLHYQKRHAARTIKN